MYRSGILQAPPPASAHHVHPVISPAFKAGSIAVFLAHARGRTQLDRELHLPDVGGGLGAARGGRGACRPEGSHAELPPVMALGNTAAAKAAWLIGTDSLGWASGDSMSWMSETGSSRNSLGPRRKRFVQPQTRMQGGR